MIAKQSFGSSGTAAGNLAAGLPALNPQLTQLSTLLAVQLSQGKSSHSIGSPPGLPAPDAQNLMPIATLDVGLRTLDALPSKA